MAIVSQNARKETLAEADSELRACYRDLPQDYFDDKSASTFLFNNIELLNEHYPTVVDEYPEEAIASHCSADAPARVYSGVPWCDQICSFCNFAFSTSKKADVHHQYIELLCQELGLLKSLGLGGMAVSSVYFGGGTPTILSDELFEGYLRRVLGMLPLTGNASVTCEATPHTMTATKSSIMRECGVTRLSMGVQSLDAAVRAQTRLLGSSQDVMRVINRSLHDFDMVNVDLIYGYPYQSDESWFDTVSYITALTPPSITLYRLEAKAGTYTLKLYERNRDAFNNELNARRKYFISARILGEAGYIESPLGWWIRQDKHTGSATWRQHLQGWTNATPYFGVGQGAWSQLARTHYANHSALGEWMAAIRDRRLPISRHNRLDSRAALLTSILRIARSAQCFDLDSLAEPLKELSLWLSFVRAVREQAAWGLLDLDGSCYHLTTAGKSLVHWLLRDLLSACLRESDRGH